MLKLRELIGRLRHGIDQRYRRSRSGSVLILVVALLVLLALLGTAYMNTARTDRYSAAQNAFNTEIDLLLQGVEDITQGAVIDGLFNGNTFHQTSDPAPAYALCDFPLTRQSAFIGDRYPTLPDLTKPVAGANQPLWNFVSMLPSIAQFESPYVGGTTPKNYSARQSLYPTYLSITQANGAATTYPALQSGGVNFLAADADGDGIADAGLFRLPVGTIGGVTYYGGVRVVDNAAALNAAIAWQPNPTTALLPGNFFPTNIDLADLLAAGDSIANLDNSGRFGPGASATSTIPLDETTGSPRSDFSFTATGGNSYEAFWMQLGRRLGNPGLNTAGVYYQALPASESQRMARKFILRDPSTGSASSSSSALEKYLTNSAFQNSNTAVATDVSTTLGPVSAAYGAAQATQWFQQNFDFGNPNMPLRAALVAQNPVSNFTYSKLNARGTYAAGAYNFGDWVLNPGDGRAYVCLQQTSTAPDPANPSNGIWERQVWTSGPTKASANTATFGQLWLAYFSAMSDTAAPGTAAALAQAAMFRSAVRVNTSVAANPVLPVLKQWTYVQQMQLRAAIAALNTLQLRNPAGGAAAPLYEDIAIGGTNQAPAFQLTIYGTAAQPYITEVYANTQGGSAASDYVAIELFNPTSQTIDLTNWQLAYVPRLNNGDVLPAPTLIPWTPPTPATLAPNSYLVIANTATPPSGIAAGPSGTVALAPTLNLALDNELILLRPGAAAGLSQNLPIPADSYDFTGLNDSNKTDWHYIRPNAPNTAASAQVWHCVYPGPYNTAATAGVPRFVGTKVGNATSPQISTLASLGAADPSPALAAANNVNSYIDRPLQVNNTDFGGANKPTASNNLFPYGGFARNADLLQVTYVGAYRLFDTTGKLLELNALPMDSAFADDQNLSTDANAVASEQMGRQNIGRFTPVSWADAIKDSLGTPAFLNEAAAYKVSVGPPPVRVFDDYWSADATMQTAYHWTLRVFDYITVQAPQDDYLPDTDPLVYPAGAPPSPAAPQPVANANPKIANASSSNVPAGATEEAVPVQGRININTANWRVLATLPMFDGVNPTTPAGGNAAYQANVQLAQNIVYYRDVDDGTMGTTLHPHGAFQSVFELNNVPIISNTIIPGPIPSTMAPGAAQVLFRNVFAAYGTANVAPALPFLIPSVHGSNTDGDLSPYTSATPSTVGQDGLLGDFENQNLALNRISNLITTRSDSFTAYVIVQGWQNVGTATPTLVVQRRGAFIIDRSTVTPSSKTGNVVNVPVN